MSSYRSLRIDKEGHGRDLDNQDIDISRTLGWFTIIYPLEISIDDEPVQCILNVDNCLTKYPPHAGYQYWRHNHGCHVVSPFLINYFGETY